MSRVAGETEAGVYEAVGLPWIPPELRENCGEIEAAEEGRLPELVELRRHPRRYPHAHHRDRRPRHSRRDGRGRPRPRLRVHRDHRPFQGAGHGQRAGRNARRGIRPTASARSIAKAASASACSAGIECDILRDGALDLANDALAELDLVIGSVHSHMRLEAAEMTDRLLRALECPHLRVLGHPTGRLLLQRDPYPFDFDRVVAEAVRRGVWLEINASPERLDLDGTLVRAAKAKGARFTISTDAHHPKHLANMRYGVVTARRGWLGPARHHEHAAQPKNSPRAIRTKS